MIKWLIGVVIVVGALYGRFLYEEDKRQVEAGRAAYEEYKVKNAKEESLKQSIWDSCTNAIRAKADVSTLKISWVPGATYVKTEGGWRIDLVAQDATARVVVECYTSADGSLIRANFR